MAVVVVMSTGFESSDWFYPQRQRCLACGRFFSSLVVKRLYDSYECAGLVPPDPDVSTWPRYCRTRVNEPKARYNCPEDVSTRNHQHETIHVYECDHCGGWHIGHQNPTHAQRSTNSVRLVGKPQQRGRRR